MTRRLGSVRKFNGKNYDWAESFLFKKRAEAFAGFMRRNGIKVRIVYTASDIIKYHTFVCREDITKYAKIHNLSLANKLISKAIAAGDRV